jgi:hypothetical protein
MLCTCVQAMYTCRWLYIENKCVCVLVRENAYYYTHVQAQCGPRTKIFAAPNLPLFDTLYM